MPLVVIDVRKSSITAGYEICTHNDTKLTGKNPVEFAMAMEKGGCGEIVVNSVDQDGVMKGYDLKLIESIREVISIPMTVLGGAKSLEDIGAIIKQHCIIGAAAGSLFVFKGKYRAVLISYPNRVEKESLFRKAFQAADILYK